MKRLKLVSILIALFILLVGLTGCNDDKSATEPEQEPSSVNDSKETEDTDEVTYDLGGRTIKIANHWDMTPEVGSYIGDLYVEKWREVEKKYNVNIEWVVVPYEEKN
ncbi:MAG: hypothetical protein LRY71_04555 [Bacillaceae bacterium]|nr:hypothetical protein [Bacillaceae bacterium]